MMMTMINIIITMLVMTIINMVIIVLIWTIRFMMAVCTATQNH